MARPDHSSLSNSREVMVRHSHFGASLGLAVHAHCALHSTADASPVLTTHCCVVNLSTLCCSATVY
jgi:hypothetical protein